MKTNPHAAPDPRSVPLPLPLPLAGTISVPGRPARRFGPNSVPVPAGDAGSGVVRAMEFPARLEALTIFYDGRCGMCCTFHEWVNRQEKLARMAFIPYQSEDAERAFPGITALEPGREMLVRDDDSGAVHRGAEAWVLCLFALTEYRGWARRLASPVLLPTAKQVCALLARNRRRLSRIFFRRKDEEVAAVLHRMPVPEPACVNGGCLNRPAGGNPSEEAGALSSDLRPGST